MKKGTFGFLFLLMVVALVNACSHKPTPSTENSAIYNLGHQRGMQLLQMVTNEDSVQELLLDTQATITRISSTQSPEEAQDFKDGFEDAIRQGNDSLATLILD